MYSNIIGIGQCECTVGNYDSDHALSVVTADGGTYANIGFLLVASNPFLQRSQR